MTLSEKIGQGRFVVTSELGPPKGIDAAKELAALEPLRERLDAVNATDLQSSVMRMGSLAMSVLLKGRGHEPVFQLTCRDRNRLALQSDLLSAAALGIENVLVLTGDHPSLGDHPEAKAVYDLDSVQLIAAAARLAAGTDMNGHALEGVPPRFFIGGVVNPCADPIEPEIIKMEKKLSAGAHFFQTQAVFDIPAFERFLALVGHLKAPIIAGIVVLKSARMARYMNEHIPGIVVPEECIARMEHAGDKVAESAAIAAALIRGLRPLCSGVHVMPIGWDRHLPRILDEAGL